MRPAGAGAVMADHAPAEVAADDPQRALWRRLEFFATPPWATRAGAELVKRLDPGASWVWDPCCGQMTMADPLAEYFDQVHATDIHPHTDRQHGAPLDFLSPAADAVDQADWIFANPPFKPAAEFVRLGLKRARRGVAIFARSGWLETLGRYELFYGAGAALSVEAVFFERVALQLGPWDPEASTATPYSWFLFFKPEIAPWWLGAVRTGLGEASVTVPIPPGTCARLTRSDDARRFGVAKAMPLFDAPVAAALQGASEADLEGIGS